MKTELVKKKNEKRKRNPEYTEIVKKKKRIEQPTQEKKGKKKELKVVKSDQKLRLVLFVGPLRVFNYNIVIEL